MGEIGGRHGGKRRIRLAVLAGGVAALAVVLALYAPRPMHRPALLGRLHHPVPRLAGASELVVVAGHTGFAGASFVGAMDSPDGWLLQPYQVAQIDAILDHIRTGVAIAAANPEAVLVFTGGATHAEVQRSEAESYLHAADAADWFGEPEVARRTVTENAARDSLENLLFSICRFREVTGRLPARITVVSFEFKRNRFTNVHRAALGFPAECFSFVGNHVADDASADLDAHTRTAFSADPFGCGAPLAAKKQARNPFATSIGYPMGCPELSALFECELVDATLLPWGDGGWCSGN